MTTRLHTLAADLDSRIQRADPQTQRQVALVAAGYGVSAAKLEDDRVMRLLTALQREEDSAILLFGAEGCVQELDELQWKLAAEIDLPNQPGHL